VLADFQIFLDVIALIQGLILAILLMIFNKKSQSSFFLGLFVFFFSLKLIRYIGDSLAVKGITYDWLFLPFNFSWLLFPLFLIYSYKVSIFSNRKPPYWTLIPGIVSIMIQIIFLFLPVDKQIRIINQPHYEFVQTYLGILYSWAIGIWNIKILCDHKEEVGNSYSQVVNRELQWIRVFLFYSLITSLIVHVLYYLAPNYIYFKIIYSFFDLFTIYWIATYGISQFNVISIYNNLQVDKKKGSEPNALSLNEEQNLTGIMQKIDDFLIDKRAYIKSNLTIIDLAESLKLHPKLISSAINKIKKKNFNLYINYFRIQKAVQLLKAPEHFKYSIEGIGKEVGFNSKSAFYKAFKRETGTTPVKYKDQIIRENLP